MQVNPFDDDDKKHWVDLFTKLELVEDTCSKDTSTNPRETKGATEKPISVEEIFTAKSKNGKIVKRAILNGLAGKGKTTLMAKLAYDWACGTALKQFKLVFLLNMSALNQGSNVMDAVFDQLLTQDTQVERDDLESFMRHNQDKVLILLDGFDELQTTSLSEHKFGSILKILNRKLLKECWVVVTTRPSHFGKLVAKSLIWKPYTHVRVLGFDKKDIGEYVHKFFSDEQDHEKVDRLLEMITESYILSDLATSPMLLLLFCLLWREYSTLPETLWGTYSEAVKFMFGRKEIDQDEISKIVIELGRVALRGLLSPGQSLSFKESEFDKDTLDKAIKAGILTRQRVIMKGLHPQDQIQFFHKTMQEFCAGEFFKDLFLTDKTEYKRTLDSFLHSLREDVQSLEYLLRFCCGNSKHCTKDILDIYRQVWKSDLNWVETSVLGCYFECQNKSLPRSEVVDMIIKPEMLIVSYINDIFVPFNYFVKCLVEEPTGAGMKYLDKVKKVKVVRMGGRNDMNPIGGALSCMNNLVDLDLGNRLDGRASGAHHFKQMKQLQKLKMAECGLIGEDMIHIGGQLSCMNNLVELYLDGNDKLGGTAALWAQHLKQLTQLQELKMSRCRLTGEDMNHIGDAFSCMKKLVYLCLDGNGKLGGTSASWAHHFKQVMQLQKLYMWGCGLIGEDMNHIGDAFSCMNNLVKLHLNANDKLGGTAASWAHCLKQLTQLQGLYLSSCGLTGEDMNHIGDASSCMNNLVELHLNGNDKLGGTAASWANHFEQLMQLQTLYMWGCGLIGEDMIICDALSCTNNLVTLHLDYNNKLGGGSAASWAHHLRQLKQLQTLYMRECGLTDDDESHLKGGFELVSHYA